MTAPVRLFAAAAAILLSVAPAASQTSWPQGSLMLVTHSSSGGGNDVMLRNLAPTLERKFEISATVDNRVGGSGAVAMTWLANQANPNGHTLLAVTPTQLITPIRAPGVPDYTQLTPIAQLFFDPSVLYVHRDSPYQSIDDFLAAARERPGSLTVGIGSAGSLDQLVLQNMQREADIQIITVPHEGGGDAIVALLGQHVDAVLGEPGQGLTHLQDGTLRLLTVFQDERLDAYPDVPTFTEVGYRVVSNKFRGLFGPPGMDPDMVEAIAEALGDLYDDEPWNS